MGLRLSEGLDVARMEAKTGYGLAPAAVGQLAQECLLESGASRVRVTAKRPAGFERNRRGACHRAYACALLRQDCTGKEPAGRGVADTLARLLAQ